MMATKDLQILNCVNNSRIIRHSLDISPKKDHQYIIEKEFEKMCVKFDLTSDEMISLVSTTNITLLENHYDTIWDGLNFYSMDCMIDIKNAYERYIYKNDINDLRIYELCDDLQGYIINNTCINSKKPCRTLNIACKKKHWNCVKYLLDEPKKHDKKNDNIRVCGTTVSLELNGKNIVDYLCACDCSLDMIKYFFQNHVNCNIKIIDSIAMASYNGNLDLVKYLFDEQYADCSDDAVNFSCRNGHLHVVKYLIEVQHKNCPSDIVDTICSLGYLDILIYLLEVQRKNYTPNSVCLACIKGHLNIVKYLFEEQNNTYSKNIIELASEHGRLNIVKYLFDVRHEDCTDDAINLACIKGHLNIVKYLLEEKNKICTSRTVNLAFEHGQYKIVRYFLERGEKYSNNSIELAIENNHLDLVEFVLAFQKNRIQKKTKK